VITSSTKIPSKDLINEPALLSGNNIDRTPQKTDLIFFDELFFKAIENIFLFRFEARQILHDLSMPSEIENLPRTRPKSCLELSNRCLLEIEMTFPTKLLHQI